jgi:hypothetical protein
MAHRNNALLSAVRFTERNVEVEVFGVLIGSQIGEHATCSMLRRHISGNLAHDLEYFR